MEKQNISFNPNKFTIWYNCYLGADVELKRTQDTLLDNKREITAGVSTEIYQKVFTLEHEEAVLNRAATKLESEMSKVLEKLVEEISFAASEPPGQSVTIDADSRKFFL